MLQRITCALVAAAFAVTTVPAPVFAQDAVGEKVQELSQEGAEAYRAGDYETAARKFEAAYELEAVPNLLYNAAKCYEKMENWDKAISLYKKFSLAPGVDPKAREAALSQIDTLKQVAALDQKEPAEEPTAEPTTPAEPAPAPPPEPDYTWSYVTLGTGVAFLAVGGVFGVLASAEESNFEVAETAQERRDARDSGETLALTADILYGVGAAATLTGIILFATAGGEEEAPAQGAATLNVTPVVGTNSIGVGMSGTF